jgi:DNA-binding transcriptional LysR family regulator
VAPHHPLASAPEPLSDEVIQKHRAVAVADSISRGAGQTFGLLSGQDVFTVPTMHAKLDAQLRGLGGGNLPRCMADSYIDTGRLVVKRTERAQRQVPLHYAWRLSKTTQQGRALQWWLSQLESPTTRNALLEEHRNA